MVLTIQTGEIVPPQVVRVQDRFEVAQVPALVFRFWDAKLHCS
jgi:hypothetical protein